MKLDTSFLKNPIINLIGNSSFNLNLNLDGWKGVIAIGIVCKTILDIFEQKMANKATEKTKVEEDNIDLGERKENTYE